jgi:hypothetical protein
MSPIRRIKIFVFLAATSILYGTAFAQTTSLSDVAWIGGHWGMSNEHVTIEEAWTAPAGGMMMGVERTISHKNNKVVEFEFLRIEERANGTYYVAQPNGKAPTDFKLVRGNASEAVFENRAHDFPKRITYRKNADGSLTASVDDGATPPKKKEEFQYKKLE